jgi:ubiquinone/menaquinone biosynthesis C-methylase UbiE
MTSQAKEVPTGFDFPTALPQTAEQAALWQERNRGWWQAHPMRYDWKTPLGIKDFSPEFYKEIDRRFFQDAEEYMPSRTRPFYRLISFEQLPEMDVLEIGVGSGSHAGLMAPFARSFTGIDLTEYAVKCASERLRQAGLNSRIVCMDAEKMEFPDRSFDFIWSWGVIHHSADTRRVLSEMRRVLRPGGRAVIMVYHRSFWTYYILSGLIHGLVRGMWFRSRSLHQIMQSTTDGGLARFYTCSEWKATVSDYFTVQKLEILGSKNHLLPLPAGRLKNVVRRCLPSPLSRVFTNHLRMGYFLVSHMRRREEAPNGTQPRP